VFNYVPMAIPTKLKTFENHIGCIKVLEIRNNIFVMENVDLYSKSYHIIGYNDG
jgi:hypothetical protein